MHSLGLLIKVYYKLFIGSLSRRMKKDNYTFGLIFLGLLSVLFIFMFASTAQTTILGYGEETEYALASLILSHLFFVIVVIILKGVSVKQSNDYEILSSLPIDKRIIVLSKIIKDFIFDFLAILCIMIPQFVVYYLNVDGIGIDFIFRGLLVAFFFAVFANAIPVIIQTGVYYLTKNLRKANLVQSLLTVFITFVFIVVYYAFYMSILDPNSGVAENLSSNIIVKTISDILLGKNYLNILIIAGISLVPFVIGVLIKSTTFRPKQHISSKNKNVVEYQPKSVMKSLIKNEAGRYFNSAIYVQNTLIGGFMLLLYAILVVSIGPNYIMELLKTTGMNLNLPYDKFICLIAVIFCALSATIVVTSCAISIEGKNFWILKAHPIDEFVIIKSKMAFNLILGIIPSVIGGIILGFVVGFTYVPFIIIISCLVVFCSASIGLLTNLKFYRFDWQEEVEVVKSGLSILITLGLVLILPAIMIAICITLINTLNVYIILSICLIVCLIAAIGFFIALKTIGVKRLKNIY